MEKIASIHKEISFSTTLFFMFLVETKSFLAKAGAPAITLANYNEESSRTCVALGLECACPTPTLCGLCRILCSNFPISKLEKYQNTTCNNIF